MTRNRLIRTLTSADRIVSASSFTSARLREMIPEIEPVSGINGVDLDLFTPEGEQHPRDPGSHDPGIESDDSGTESDDLGMEPDDSGSEGYGSGCESVYPGNARSEQVTNRHHLQLPDTCPPE